MNGEAGRFVEFGLHGIAVLEPSEIGNTQDRGTRGQLVLRISGSLGRGRCPRIPTEHSVDRTAVIEPH